MATNALIARHPSLRAKENVEAGPGVYKKEVREQFRTRKWLIQVRHIVELISRKGTNHYSKCRMEVKVSCEECYKYSP
jgi:hypothetical protein